jgi:ABC-type multidrug transport system ATPase subunit
VAVGRLSAGQKRRTALACLVARRAQVWLLDEPHAGLDHETRDQLDGLIGRAVRQGATVLLASHELDRAESLAHRVVELAGGTTAPSSGAPAGGSAPQAPPQHAPAAPPPEVSHVA